MKSKVSAVTTMAVVISIAAALGGVFFVVMGVIGAGEKSRHNNTKVDYVVDDMRISIKITADGSLIPLTEGLEKQILMFLKKEAIEEIRENDIARFYKAVKSRAVIIDTGYTKLNNEIEDSVFFEDVDDGFLDRFCCSSCGKTWIEFLCRIDCQYFEELDTEWDTYRFNKIDK